MRIRSIVLALVILLCAALGASAQGIAGLNPTPVGLYQWNSATNQPQPVANSYGSFALSSPPQPMIFYGWNASLGQWVPCSIQQPCLVASAGVTQIIPGLNITISPSGGTGAVTINAATGAGSPLTAKGDIYGFSSTNARIPVGADGTVLTAASAQLLGVQWQFPAFQSLTTNGTSGPATLAAGQLNIPNYAGGSGSGVQYPTYTYVMMGSSIQTRDDVHVLGQTITVTSGPCASGTCSITNSGTNGLSVGDWVMVGGLTGFPQPTFGGINALGTNLDTFKVTAATATTFSFAYPGTATITGGTAYGFNFVPPYLTQTRPYFAGHGTVETIGLWPSGGTYGLCTDMNTDYTATYHTIATSNTMFIITDCHNDFAIGTTAATVEAAVQALAAKIHADGALLVVEKPIPQGFGNFQSAASPGYQSEQFGMWLNSFTKSFLNVGTKQYADGIIDMDAVINNMFDTNTYYNFVGLLNPGGVQRVADELNNFMASAATSKHASTPWWQWRTDYLTSQCIGCGGGLTFTPPGDSPTALAVTNAADTLLAFSLNSGSGALYAVSGSFQQLNVSNPGTASVVLGGIFVPNLGASATAFDLLGTAASTNNTVVEQYNNVAAGSASNNWALEWYGAASSFLRSYANGEVDLPGQAPASGTDCLQIASGTGAITNTGSPCGSGSSGLSGMTAGQVPIAATATAVTSSKALAGAGTGITTGPTTTTLNDCVKFGDTAGTLADAGAACGSGGGVADTAVAVTGATQTANSCSTTSNVTMTGLTTSMVVHTGYSANPATLTGWGSTGGMVFQIWPSAANTATWQVCNQTAASITYSAITFNVGAN